MPRANRYITKGRTYHLTHRCHDRAFLLRFQKDRNTYRAMLRERLASRRVWLLGYCLTSNHVHLLCSTESKDQIAGLMQSLAGDFAQHYNLRKGRSGAFWGDRYHATLIEGERHLWNCLKYIDLNMVRARAVTHPRDWTWCGYHELVGTRTRYRLVDQERLVQRMGDGCRPESFKNRYAEAIDEACRAGSLDREPMWTESMAVGSKAYVETVETSLKNRKRTEVQEAEDGTWVLREKVATYA